ncbi:MAG: nucleotide exchange factor GrpE [Pseudomonadota bacterium]
MMSDQRKEVVIKTKDSQPESELEKQEELTEKINESGEKPLEEMTQGELIGKVKEVQRESGKNYDLYLRSQAEIENIKRRGKREKEDWIKYANETLIKEILPVIDNLEKAISHSDNENALHALREGIELTLKGLKDTLSKSGLEEVKALGEPFDPNFHEAVSEQGDANVKPGIILHELQRGYILNKRLIRPAMVVVSKGKPDH